MNNTNKEAQEQKNVQDQRKATREKEAQEKRDKQFWDSLITRKEAYELSSNVSNNVVMEHMSRLEDRLRILYVSIRTISDLLVEKGILTDEDIKAKGRAIMEEIYGKEAVEAVQKRIDEAVAAEEAREVANAAAGTQSVAGDEEPKDDTSGEVTPPSRPPLQS